MSDSAPQISPVTEAPVFQILKVWTTNLSVRQLVELAPQALIAEPYGASLSLTAKMLGKDLWETALDVRVTVGHPSGPAFMAEISQHGRVSMVKVADPEALMNVYMGHFLMNYVRHYMAEAFSRAGYAPLVLPENDWQAAFEARKAEEARLRAQASGAHAALSGESGPQQASNGTPLLH